MEGKPGEGQRKHSIANTAGHWKSDAQGFAEAFGDVKQRIQWVHTFLHATYICPAPPIRAGQFLIPVCVSPKGLEVVRVWDSFQSFQGFTYRDQELVCAGGREAKTMSYGDVGAVRGTRWENRVVFASAVLKCVGRISLLLNAALSSCGTESYS